MEQAVRAHALETEPAAAHGLLGNADRALGGWSSTLRARWRVGIRPIWGYTAAMLVGLALVAAIPWISIGFL